jgi:hypothetical protein
MAATEWNLTTSFFEVIDWQIRHKISEDFLTSTSKQILQMRCLHPSSYRFAFLLQTKHKIGNFELGSARMIGLRPLRASLTMSSWKIKQFWPSKILSLILKTLNDFFRNIFITNDISCSYLKDYIRSMPYHSDVPRFL